MVELENLIAVLGKIEDHGKVAALTTKACATPSRENRRSMHAAKPHRSDCILDISWNNNANWNLPIIGSVARVERTISIAESDLSFDHVTKRMLEFT